MSFIQQLNWRFATKHFDTEKPVSKTDLEQILHAARMAPSSYGLQPYHILVVSDPEMRSKLQPVSYGQAQIVECSDLLVFCARGDISARIDNYAEIASNGDVAVLEKMSGYIQSMHNALDGLDASQQLAWASKQAYIALGFALAAASELSVDACPMEGFDSKSYSELLQLDSNLTPVALCALGHRTESDSVHSKTRFSETDLFSYHN